MILDEGDFDDEFVVVEELKDEDPILNILYDYKVEDLIFTDGELDELKKGTDTR